jgi:16S rRNA (uracil1498-N3)-methyltransferase
MRRYWIPKDQINLPHITIKDESFHHIFDVCRQQMGSQFEVLGDGSFAHLVEVKSVQKKSAQAEVISSRQLPPRPKPDLVLCLSFPRFPVLDAVIEKAVEMGVHEIRLFYSEFSFIRSAQSFPESKADRWAKIIQSATQQSGRGDLMTVANPVPLPQLLKSINQSPEQLCLFAYEGASTLSIKDSLEAIPRERLESFQTVFIFVGSEGGFSSTEVEAFRQTGLAPVTLGDQVLRVETACITLVAILKYYFGQMRHLV